jgi:hypothetical protein
MKIEEIIDAVQAEWGVGGLDSGTMYGEFAIEVNKRATTELQAALREALDQWESWNRSELEGPSGWLCDGGKHANRITELRKQFLKD